MSTAAPARAFVRRAAALLLASVASSAWAADGIRTERVHFAKGATSATVEGTLRGYETVDYVVGAAKGQSMNVSLATKHTSTYFNILAPGQSEEAFFIGSTDGNQYEGVLPATGDYRIRVYMMRSAARRNEVAKYRLEMIVTGATHTAAAPAAATAAVAAPAAAKAGAAPRFDATGKVPCARHRGQPTGPCDFGVKRGGGGDATVVVTHPDGFRRTIYFVKGRAVRADDGAGAFGAQKQSDLNLVTVGDERYEIPDAAVFGG